GAHSARGSPVASNEFHRLPPLHKPSRPVLRPRKKYTVFDLQQLKGKRCLTHIHVKSPQEAAAAEEAGVDLMSCSFDSPEAQSRLPALLAAAPHSFLSPAPPHGLASREAAVRVAFRALGTGAGHVD